MCILGIGHAEVVDVGHGGWERSLGFSSKKKLKFKGSGNLDQWLKILPRSTKTHPNCAIHFSPKKRVSFHCLAQVGGDTELVALNAEEILRI
ncbi:MAG: hypothetical protein KME22_25065 [Hassallia sp. WJT32-NPBG1]|nr:hypothetical protein [Hassallia sp. WJT32-NPBG1]